ncbi:hypothetical protein E1I69_18265 [Bacillus timonensis]|uniref:Carrier domain-containing protein n=1 Tax=Bacillus timonensis TaxID=1033734 RepID=A0A4S3PM68_9BACI|nr:phosphopantetheine-binding protein [Bacillus timonensis]THE10621.1 hypothetical protein E1I69_18265 [Bacillus timonensis]
MTFKDFTKVMFDLLDLEEVEITETSSLRDDLNIDSLQMVNLTTSLAEHYKIPFRVFIENGNKIDIVGELYTIVTEESL